MHISNLPKDVFLYLLSWLDILSLRSLSLTSRNYWEVLLPYLEQALREKIQKEYPQIVHEAKLVRWCRQDTEIRLSRFAPHGCLLTQIDLCKESSPWILEGILIPRNNYRTNIQVRSLIIPYDRIPLLLQQIYRSAYHPKAF